MVQTQSPSMAADRVMRLDDQLGAEDAKEVFIRLLTAEQTQLFSYIVMLLGDVNDANNVLQQANLVLWRKIDEFDINTNFHLWARKVAYYQTLAFLRDRKRD